MATSRPFAYNVPSPIAGTEQVGDLAVGHPDPISGYNDAVFWNGPDEDLGYVIAEAVPGNTQPTPATPNRLYLSTTYKATDIALSNNNQTADQVFSYQQSVLGERLVNTNDKIMFSVQFNSTNPTVGVGGRFIGLGKTGMNYSGPFNGYPGNDDQSTGFSDDGKLYYNGSVIETGLPTWGDGDIIDIVINNNWWIRVNGGTWNNNIAGVADPSVNNGYVDNNAGVSYPVLCPYIYGSMTIQNYPEYDVPLGFKFLGNELASVGFFRTSTFDDQEFIDLASAITQANYANADDASIDLTGYGYWNSYAVPVLSLDAADYTSGNWIDSVGSKAFTLHGSPTWSSSNGGYFNFDSASDQFADCGTSLPDLNTWTVGVWHYYDGSNTGSAPCIVTEVYPGNSSRINYSLGDNNGGFSTGFFNGSSWVIGGTYSLTPNNWYYIVGVYDGSAIKLYVNGSLVSGTGGISGNPISSQGGIRLMRRWDLGDYWGGKLAKVDIYGRALNPGQITSIWNSTKSRFGL